MLGTYASALKALTAEQEVGRLRISPLVITSGGELLTPAVQRRAEEAFGCLANQTYGASEAIPLALPCRHGRLHVNTDWFLLGVASDAAYLRSVLSTIGTAGCTSTAIGSWSSRLTPKADLYRPTPDQTGSW